MKLLFLWRVHNKKYRELSHYRSKHLIQICVYKDTHNQFYNDVPPENILSTISYWDLSLFAPTSFERNMNNSICYGHRFVVFALTSLIYYCSCASSKNGFLFDMLTVVIKYYNNLVVIYCLGAGTNGLLSWYFCMPRLLLYAYYPTQQSFGMLKTATWLAWFHGGAGTNV